MVRQGQRTFSKDRAFDLKQNFMIFDQEFDFVIEKIRLEIKEIILSFYENNPASRLTPRMLTACVVDHYRSQQKIQITQGVICQKLGVEIYSFHKLKNSNLRKMGIIPYKPQITVKAQLEQAVRRSL